MSENHSIEKICPKCEKIKSLDLFYRLNSNSCDKIKDRKNGVVRDKGTHTSWCKECRLARNRSEQKSRRESGEQAVLNKRWYPNVWRRILKSRYGITVEEYEAMAMVQNNCCAICLRPESTKNRKGTEKRLSVDHDHKNGKLRQLLCHNCNCGLGRFMDDPSVLERAAEYLRRHTE